MLLYKNIIVRSLPYHYRSAILLHYNRPCPPLTAWYLNHFSLTSLVLLQEKSTEGRRDMDPKGRQNFWYMQITPILPIIFLIWSKYWNSLFRSFGHFGKLWNRYLGEVWKPADWVRTGWIYLPGSQFLFSVRLQESHNIEWAPRLPICCRNIYSQ